MYARKIVSKSVFYKLPIESDLFSIFKSNGVLSEVTVIKIKYIDKKIFAMPFGNEFVFAPLRH